MKSAHKVNNRIATSAEVSTEAAHAREVSFIMMSKGVIGFRESAHIINVAEETGCEITIAAGKKLGTNASILSLINLGITSGKSLVLNIKGERNEEAFREISKIISGETDSNS